VGDQAVALDDERVHAAERVLPGRRREIGAEVSSHKARAAASGASSSSAV
jgi:hypothetical protein